MDGNEIVTLAREFRAAKGSFLLQLRIEMHWDKEVFRRLTEVMRACCKYYEYSQEQLERERNEQLQWTEEQLNDEQFIEEYCLQKNAHDTMLPRWLADGFWYLATFVRGHTSHPAWQKTIARDPEYFARAYRLLDHLASWFFRGRCPWHDEEKGWSQESA